MVGFVIAGLDNGPKVPLLEGNPVGLVGKGFIGAPGASIGFEFCSGSEPFGEAEVLGPVGAFVCANALADA